MKVKELLKKYKDYDIQLFGKPLKNKCIPFTFIPRDKEELDNCVVKELEIKEKKHVLYACSFKDLKCYRTENKLGYVYAYVVKEEGDK